MGWSTAPYFECTKYNETIIINNANLMVSLGLKDAGYTYVNVDDCWSQGARDPNGHI